VHLSRPVAELRGADRIRDVVRQRLSRLDQETNALLELAAVIGPRFEVGVLAAAAGLDRDALVDAVEKATRSGMIEELPEPAHACRFTHELLRRVVYDRITSIRRAELHLRVGEALERVHQADPARVLPELAHHFTLAASVAGADRGVEYNLRNADAAMVAAAYDEAAARLSSALELGIADPRERARVQVELAYVSTAETTSERRALLAASLDAATSLGERGIAAHALLHQFGFVRTGDPEFDPALSRAVDEQVIETLTELGDVRGLALAFHALARVLRRQGRAAESCAAAERALVHAEACDNHGARRQAIGVLAWVLCDGPAPVDGAIRRCERLLRSSRNERGLEALVRRCLSVLLAMAGRFEEARVHAMDSELAPDEVNQIRLRSVWRTVVADSKEILGDRRGAEQVLTETWQSVVRLRAHVPDAQAMQAAYHLALLYCDEGRWDAAERCLAYGRDVPVPTYFRREAVVGLAARARLAAHRGELAEAVTLAQRAVELAELSDLLNVRARVWQAVAEVQRANGETAAAETAVARALELYEQKGNVAAAADLRKRAVST
jgi:tetratricopeptide (TPR) repeat protein